MRGWCVDQEPNGVREDVDNRIKLFDTTLWRTRRVADNRRATDAGDTTTESTEWADESHRFGKARGLALDDLPSSFRRLIARRETRAAGGHDDTNELTTHLAQGGGNVGNAIGTHTMLDNLEAVIDKLTDQRTTTYIVSGALRHAIADGEYLCLEGSGEDCHLDER